MGSWMTANFTAATRGKRNRLKALQHYLSRKGTAHELTDEETAELMDAARAWADQLNARGGTPPNGRQ